MLSLLLRRSFIDRLRIRTFQIAVVLLMGMAIDASAQIPINNISDKTVYTTSASFLVVQEAGYSYNARLDGQPVPVGVSVPVTAVDYHELSVVRTNNSTQATTSRLVQFIVRSAERGNSEDGLPPWTPYPSIPSATGEFAGGTFRIIAPAAFPQNIPIPVVAWVEDEGGHALRVNGRVKASGQKSFRLVRGAGSGFLSGSNSVGPMNYQPAVGGLMTNKVINVETGTVWTAVSGVLSGSINWPTNSRIAITGGILLSSGATLNIGAGTIVRVSAGVDITNRAAVFINGTREQPVVFTPISPGQPWGGFIMPSSEGSITATGAIFTGSGAQPNWFGFSGRPDSHRPEQALFYCAGVNTVSMVDSAAIYLPGQLGHAVNGGTFVFKHFLNQLCTSGGEYSGASSPLSFVVNDSAFIEYPDDTANFVDGDNDALYLVHGTHRFTNTLVGFTKDDGIDSGGSGAASLIYKDCWFESIFHEGNSLSGSGKQVSHVGGVFINCGQGLESGYEGPSGTLNGCLATGNLVGGRFGDNYNWNYSGFLRATNSLLIYNYRDVWGRTWNDWAYHTGNMDVRSNLLTVPDSFWPANGIWNPATDAARLADFITGSVASPVGVGFALRTNRLSITALTNGIPVRLSRFSTNVVSVDYLVETPDSKLASGSLTFQPGETVKKLNVSFAIPPSYDLLSVSLVSPVNADVTGIPQVFAVPGGTFPLQHALLGGYLVLFWSDGAYWLEQAEDVSGPWTRVEDGVNPASVRMTESQQFYRLQN